MTDRRLAAWARILCAVALALGLSAAAGAVTPEALHARPVVAHIHHGFDELSRTAVGAPGAVRHAISRHVPPTLTASLLVAAAAVGGLVATWLRRRRSADGAGRRTSPTGARAPPVAIGI